MTPSFSATPLALEGTTIVITRAAGQAGALGDRLRAWGAQVIEMPALEMGPPSSWAALDDALQSVMAGQVDWIIFSSTNGIDAVAERLAVLGKTLDVLRPVSIAVVGQKTATHLQRLGLTPRFIPPDFVADAVVEHFPLADVSGLRIVLPRVESGGRDVLVQGFRERGAIVVEVPAYESHCPRAIAPDALIAFQEQRVNIVTFASSKTVRNFCQLLEQALGQSWLQFLTPSAIASIGPQTSETCRALLGRVDIEAQEYTLEGLTHAIVTWSTAHPLSHPNG